ncbi:MAG: carbohydrate ABC transporter permease [Tissierellia bacterium]|nr:carbohydrate ABC transporter permease [Tissierellia bacterium]
MKKYLRKFLYFLCVTIFMIFTLGPLLWTLVISFTPESELLKHTSSLLPSKLYWGNYSKILSPGTSSHTIIFQGLKNSMEVSFLTILLGLPICVAGGYGFSRFLFPGRKVTLTFILATIIIPLFTTIIPIFSIFSNYGFLDNKFWLTLVYISSFIPMVTWMNMIFFNTLPEELWEAARVDGCNEWEAFTKVILPISYPILITTALMLFLMSWNQFQVPLILTSSQKNKVLTLVLSEFMSRDTISYGLIAVSGILAIIPPGILAVIFRHFLISGLTSGSVKG